MLIFFLFLFSFILFWFYLKAWCTTRADSVAQESVKYILHKTCQKKSSEQNIYTFTISAFEIEIILAEMSGGGADWRKDINLEPSSVWGKHFSWDNFVMIWPMSTVQKNPCFPSLTTNYWLLRVSGDHFVCFYNLHAVSQAAGLQQAGPCSGHDIYLQTLVIFPQKV